MAISAHSVISHSANAKAITATTGAGNLMFNVGTGGHIELAGLTIDIAGNMLASGAGASMSFGRLTAKSIALSAGSTGKVQLTEEGVVSGMAKLSATATAGHIFITAGHINALSSGSLNLKATGSIDLHGSVDNHGNVGISAGGVISASKIISTNGNVKLTAKTYATNAGSLDVSAAGNITIKGAIGGSASTGVRFHGNVKLDAGNNISLDHGIFLNASNTSKHTIYIIGKHLAYTGAGAFGLSGGFGDLLLDASIGSAAAPVKYAVHLTDAGYGLYVDRSIYTGGSLEIEELNFSNLTGSQSGAHIEASNGKPVTLSAKGAITLVGGERVTIGGSAAIVVTAGSDLKITSKEVEIGGYEAVVSSGSANHSVTLHAGHDVTISASDVYLVPGEAAAVVAGGVTKATANTNIIVSAGDDIKLTATGGVVEVGYGEAFASFYSDSKSGITATATAAVKLAAGNDVDINAKSIDLLAGHASFRASTAAVKQTGTATATAGLSVTAGHNINVTGTSQVFMVGGTSVAHGDRVNADQSGAKATATAHADLTLSAGDAFTASAPTLTVRGGNNVGGAREVRCSFTSRCSSATSVNWAAAGANALGKKASANYTATGNTSITAGAGGITLSGTKLILGDDPSATSTNQTMRTAIGMRVYTDSAKSATAIADAEATLNLSTTGNMTVTGHSVSVRGGDHTAGWLLYSYNSVHGYHSSSQVRASIYGNGKGDILGITAKSGISLKAGGNLTITATAGNLSIEAGSHAGSEMSVYLGNAASGGKNNTMLDASMSLTAGGKLKVSAAGDVIIGAGKDALYAADASAYGGTVSLTVNSSLILSGAKGLSVSAAGPDLSIFGGYEGASHAQVHAFGAGKAALTADTSVGVSATGGAISLKNTSGGIYIFADDYNASEAVASASDGGVANLTAKNGVSVKAGGAFIASAHTNLEIWGGSSYAAYDAKAKAEDGGAKASLTADESISVTAGSVSLKAAHYMSIAAGFLYDADNAHASAGGSATASLKETSSVKIATTGAFTASAAGSSLKIYGAEEENGYGATAKADGAHASATLSADGSLTITAGGAVNLKAGKKLLVYGGTGSATSSAGNGQAAAASANHHAKASYSEKSGVSITAGGAFTAKAGTGLDIYGALHDGYGAVAKGSNGGSANFTASGAVALKAASVALSASAGNLEIYGGDDVAETAGAVATGTGKSHLTANAGVSITAATGFTAQLLGSAAPVAYLGIYGGDDAGYAGDASAGANATAMLTANAGVNIAVTGAGGKLTLTTGTRPHAAVSIGGGADVASDADAKSSYAGAVTSVTATSAVNLSAAGAVSITAGHGSVGIYGASCVDCYNSVKATGKGAQATVTGNGSVSIKGGSVALTAGTAADMLIEPYYYAGYSDDVTGASGGAAAVNANAGVTIAAAGNFSAKAGKKIVLQNGYYDAYDAYAIGKTGGTATIDTNASLTITAGGTLKASAGTGIDAGIAGSVGYDAHASADTGGKANLNINDHMSLVAGGALSLKATAGNMSIYGGDETAYEAEADASNGGQANLIVNTSISIKGSSLTISALGAGADVDAHTGEDAGSDASIYATNAAAHAAMTIDANISLVATTGVFTASAGGSISLTPGESNVEDAFVGAKGVGATAKIITDNSVAVSGKSVVLKAADDISLHGGYYADYGARGYGSSGGVATLSTKASLNITASSAFSALITGAGHGQGLSIYGGYETGYNAEAHGLVGGKASLTDDASVDITVTAATGKVNLNTGAETSAYLDIGVNGSVASDAGLAGVGASAEANYAGAAAISVNDSVNISAKGAVTITTTAGGAIFAIAGASKTGSHAKASASGAAALASVTADGAVSIVGGSLSLTNTAGSIDFVGGADAGVNETGVAANGGTVNLTMNAGLLLSATGAITAKAHDLNVETGLKAGSHAEIVAEYGAKGTGVAISNVTLTAGGNLSLTGSDRVVMEGGSKAAYEAVAVAGSSAAAKLTVQANLSLHAGGNYTEKANGDLDIEGAPATGMGNVVEAEGVGANAALNAQATVNISAGGGVTLDGALSNTGGDNSFTIAEIGEAGIGNAVLASDGGVVADAAASRISITAGGALNLSDMGSGLIMYGGLDFGAGAHVRATHGKASLSVSGGVGLAAGGTMTLNLNGGNLVIATLGNDGESASVEAGPAGAAKANITGSIGLVAAGDMLIEGVNNLVVTTGALTHHAAMQDSGGGVATALVNEGINLLGAKVTVHATTKTVTAASDAVTSDGLTEKVAITVTGGLSVLSFSPLSVRDVFQETLSVDPLDSGTSFGERQTLQSMPTTDFSAPALQTGSLTDGMRVTGGSDAPLSTLNDMALVTDLIAVASSTPAPALGDAVPVSASFVTEVDTRPYRESQAQACTDTRLSTVGACLALK